jgi:hypothetical protein
MNRVAHPRFHCRSCFDSVAALVAGWTGFDRRYFGTPAARRA